MYLKNTIFDILICYLLQYQYFGSPCRIKLMVFINKYLLTFKYSNHGQKSRNHIKCSG
jgi:hypothetical protein